MGSLHPYRPQLWMGWSEWPREFTKAGSLEEWEGLTLLEEQTGKGVPLLDRRFFGLAFQIPADEPAGVFVEGLRVPYASLDPVVPDLDGVLRIRQSCEELRLALDPVRYSDVGDGYLPLEFFSAWRYAAERRLQVIQWCGKQGAEFIVPVSLGLFTCDDARAYIRAAWEATSSCSTPTADPCAAIVA